MADRIRVGRAKADEKQTDACMPSRLSTWLAARDTVDAWYEVKHMPVAGGPFPWFLTKGYSIPNGPGTIGGTSHSPKKHSSSTAWGTINNNA
jgi:hypothetical protein